MLLILFIIYLYIYIWCCRKVFLQRFINFAVIDLAAGGASSCCWCLALSLILLCTTIEEVFIPPNTPMLLFCLIRLPNNELSDKHGSLEQPEKLLRIQNNYVKLLTFISLGGY